MVALDCLLVREILAVHCLINVNFYLMHKEMTKSSMYKKVIKKKNDQKYFNQVKKSYCIIQKLCEIVKGLSPNFASNIKQI